DLGGVSVIVAGAGLAGLAAAYDLVARGANVTVVEARDRVGGRVWTIHNGFAEGQHAEAGGDMIDEEHREIRDLAADAGLTLTRLLRGGFASARTGAGGTPPIVARAAMRGWERLARDLHGRVVPYNRAERRWDTPIATAIASRSVSAWLDAI